MTLHYRSIIGWRSQDNDTLATMRVAVAESGAIDQVVEFAPNDRKRWLNRVRKRRTIGGWLAADELSIEQAFIS